MSFARYALYCGGAAGAASMATVMLAAMAEGRSPLQPVNATSHWIWGDEAGRHTRPDIAHTLTGAVTNQSAAMFWGALFGAWLSSRPPRSTAQMFRDAAAMGVIATTLDYGILPRRLSPGWELALSRPSVGLSMAAMALGLALGGLAAQEPRMRRRRSRHLTYAA
jgi:hypothetical protein